LPTVHKILQNFESSRLCLWVGVAAVFGHVLAVRVVVAGTVGGGATTPQVVTVSGGHKLDRGGFGSKLIMLAGTLRLMHLHRGDSPGDSRGDSPGDSRGDSVTTWLWLGRPATQQVEAQVNRYSTACVIQSTR